MGKKGAAFQTSEHNRILFDQIAINNTKDIPLAKLRRLVYSAIQYATIEDSQEVYDNLIKYDRGNLYKKEAYQLVEKCKRLDLLRKIWEWCPEFRKWGTDCSLQYRELFRNHAFAGHLEIMKQMYAWSPAVVNDFWQTKRDQEEKAPFKSMIVLIVLGCIKRNTNFKIWQHILKWRKDLISPDNVFKNCIFYEALREFNVKMVKYILKRNPTIFDSAIGCDYHSGIHGRSYICALINQGTALRNDKIEYSDRRKNNLKTFEALLDWLNTPAQKKNREHYEKLIAKNPNVELFSPSHINILCQKFPNIMDKIKEIERKAREAKLKEINKTKMIDSIRKLVEITQKSGKLLNSESKCLSCRKVYDGKIPFIVMPCDHEFCISCAFKRFNKHDDCPRLC